MRYVTVRFLAVVVLAGLVGAAPAQPLPRPDRKLPEAPGTVGAREWARRLTENLADLQKGILEEVPGPRGRELYKRTSILLEQARSLQEMIRFNAAQDRLQYDVRRGDQKVLQDHINDLDEQMHALLKELGDLATDKASAIQRAAQRSDYIEQHLYTSLVRGNASEIPVPRQVRLLAEEAQSFSRAADLAAQGNLDGRRLAADAKLFAAEADHFRETLDLGYTREPSRADFARVSTTWDRIQLDLRLVPRSGNQTLFDRAERIGNLYDRLARQLGVIR
jgi:hypothetical protein